MKLIIFALSLENKHELFQPTMDLAKELQHEIVGIATLEPDKTQNEGEIPIFSLPYVKENMADLLILPYYDWQYQTNKNLILTTLKDIWHFPENKISISDELMKEFLSVKYRDSLDKEIQDTLKFWENHDMSPFNQYIADAPDTFDEVFFDDKANLPYIFFETVGGKKLKMYYPKNYKFEHIDGKAYVKNILHEQLPTSPHLYTTGGHKVNEGDILIDAGVCEGNFALKYVDVAKKIYLFENNSVWINALSYTFKNMNNVEIIDKGVSNETTNGFVKIDDVIDFSPKNRYFLKMDVEGYEIMALNGAEKLLKTDNVTSSICTYHRYQDDTRIRIILEKYGYKTSFSKGYMTFSYTPEFWQTRDFRHAIIYGD